MGEPQPGNLDSPAGEFKYEKKEFISTGEAWQEGMRLRRAIVNLRKVIEGGEFAPLEGVFDMVKQEVESLITEISNRFPYNELVLNEETAGADVSLVYNLRETLGKALDDLGHAIDGVNEGESA